jgi:glycine betaine/proline transport system permease protein/glycine betaine/proline transport system substrate-binding protein
MNLKKKLALLLALLMLVTAAGCGASSGSASSGPAETSGGNAAEASAAPSAPVEKTEIVFADPGWDSILFHNAVAGLVAEEVFGYTWSEVTGSTPICHEALMSGDLDVHMEVWTDNIATYEDDAAEGRLQELSTNYDDDMQGFYVPRYVIEGAAARGIAPMAPDLKPVEDLKKYPDVFKDEEDPSKGRVYGAIPGWAIDEIMHKKYEYYGLDESFNYFQPGSDAALSAAMVSAYDKGEPIVAYYWEPTWLVGMYDFVLLEDAPYSEEAFYEGACACPAVPVTVCVGNDFYASNPDYCAFLSKYQTSSALTGEALAYMQDSGADYEEAARWFLQQHPELIDEWLDADQASTLKAALA